MTPTVLQPDLAWEGPGSPARRGPTFSWHRLVWRLVFPQRRHRIAFTVPGVFLIGLSMGIGTAAYNTASNILFITLSLLLACLMLSGLLSWFNFKGLCWRIPVAGPWRVGHETMVAVRVKNTKQWLPSYGLWFDLRVQPVVSPAFSAADENDSDVRAAFAAFDNSATVGRVSLRERVEPGGETGAEWSHRPAQRGAVRLELLGVGSLFPFGFLRKNIGADMRQTVLVWPAQVEYQWLRRYPGPAGGWQGRRTSQAGSGEDLLALRKYAQGDSHRLVHWKASARLGRLMVRQYAAETPDGFTLQLETPGVLWTQPAQFELLCGFAATLAEDLYAEGRLRGVVLNGGTWRAVQNVRDLESFLNDLAMLQPTGEPPGPATNATTAAGQIITFAPNGARGITAHVNGIATASA